MYEFKTKFGSWWIWITCAVIGWSLLSPLSTRAATTEPAGVWLESSLPSKLPVGQTVRWTLRSTTVLPATVRYRFRVGLVGKPLQTVRDFARASYFSWTPMTEGTYQVEAAVNDTANATTVFASQSYEVVTRLTGSSPLLLGTDHPLVFLYSMPPCTSGQVRVRFHPQSGADWNHTHWRPCNGKNVNFYIAGMRPDTVYEVQHEIAGPTGSTLGPLLRRRTGVVVGALANFTVRDPEDVTTSSAEPVLLHSMTGVVANSYFPVATDLQGRPLWYYRFPDNGDGTSTDLGVEYATRILPARSTMPGGTVLIFTDESGKYGQILREIDLAGQPLRETNVEQINRQLAARGAGNLECFEHEATQLPNGDTLVLGYVVREVKLATTLSKVTVIGDMIVALDTDWQVRWSWSGFDHLDVNRQAVLDERWWFTKICNDRAVPRNARDWMHSNSIDYSPADGNLILSMRHQDWVVKIDYRNGTGTGDILWRLGAGGDFKAITDQGEAYPWFSHQHDVRWDGDKLLVFDNGNTRCRAQSDGCNSRGQVWQIREATREAVLLVNADLGVYSSAYGSSQKLSNGDYHFLAGNIVPGLYSRSIEVAPPASGLSASAATRNYVLEADIVAYRSFRLPNLYSAPLNATPLYSASLPPAELFLPLIGNCRGGGCSDPSAAGQFASADIYLPTLLR